MRRLLTTGCLLLLSAALLAAEQPASEEEQFARVAATLSSAGCIELEFLNIIESDIFNTVDTFPGQAVLSDDGRYNIQLAQDVYLFTGDELYNYSAPNNQVVIEEVPQGAVVSDQISFLTRLDHWYNYEPADNDGEYHLSLKPGMTGDMPDSMTAVIDRSTVTIKTLEYYDINDELNRIIFEHQNLSDNCPDSLFKPDFADSVDVLRL